MIEFETLQHLIAFEEYKTLSSAAKALHVSQPVLTRSMQKLEEALEVQLFDRAKNRIALNDTGLMAVEYAKRIVSDANSIKNQIKAFDRKQHTFSIGSCAPAPNILLSQKASTFFPEKTISSEIKDMEILRAGLADKTYSVIIMPYDIEDDDIESIPFMDEALYFSLPYDHPLAKAESLYLKDLDGQKMLLMSNIGFWHSIHKNSMPNTKFLIQEDRGNFYDLIELSSLPSFTSSFSMYHDGMPPNRKIIPIKDKEAQATFYCWYRKEDEKKFASLLYHLNEDK